MSGAEQHLLAELMDGVDRLKREVKYNPTYFTQMVAEHGPVETCRRLIRAKDASDGFTHLWELGKLDMTVEAICLLPWYSDLLEPEDAVLARRRLEAYRFDVDGFLHSRVASPPVWVARNRFEGQQR